MQRLIEISKRKQEFHLENYKLHYEMIKRFELELYNLKRENSMICINPKYNDEHCFTMHKKIITSYYNLHLIYAKQKEINKLKFNLQNDSKWLYNWIKKEEKYQKDVARNL